MLLDHKGVHYTEIDVEKVSGARQEMNKRSGRTEMIPDGVDPGWDANPGMVAIAA